MFSVSGTKIFDLSNKWLPGDFMAGDMPSILNIQDLNTLLFFFDTLDNFIVEGLPFRELPGIPIFQTLGASRRQ
jgi:hypothetical protein